jgi:putative transposase
VALTLIYRMFVTLLSWIVLRTRSDTTNEIEILVLRHQLTVLQRRTPPPRMRWTTEPSSPHWPGCCQHAAASAC